MKQRGNRHRRYSLEGVVLLWVVLAVWAAMPVHGADPKPAASRNRFSLLESTTRETDIGQAAVLYDRVTGQAIILADPEDGKGLRGISRGFCDGCLMEVSILPVDRTHYYVVVEYGYEPLGNDTVHVQVLDPVTHQERFHGRSRFDPLVVDINGDGAVELVLFFDTEDFQHPEASVWPVIHALDQDGMLQRQPPDDPAYRAYMENTEAEFERFLHRLETECEEAERKWGECLSWTKNEVAKARKQLQHVRRVLGR